MKHLIDIINEGNIDRCERKYREFCGICSVHKVDPKDVIVCKTSKGNWIVRDKDDNKLFIVSNHILNDDVIEKKGLVKKNSDKIKNNYNAFSSVCAGYGVSPEEVCVHKHPDGPWSVYKDGKKIFTVSPYIFDDDLANDKEFKKCKKSIYEAKKQYYITFMQYDPDVQAEYEDGDVDDDELHDSMYEADYDYEYFDANNDKEAVRKAEPIIKKFANKHPEIVAGCVYTDGDIVETIFI